MSIGTNTYIDNLLAEYLPPERANHSMISEVFESERNALLFAILTELRGNTATAEDNETANYISTNQVAESDEQSVNWGFSAGTVVLYGFDQPIQVAFKEPGTPGREITLNPDDGDEPAEFAPLGGLNTAEMWFKTTPAATGDTVIRTLAFE